jgi:hypothetical protein
LGKRKTESPKSKYLITIKYKFMIFNSAKYKNNSDISSLIQICIATAAKL